MKNHNFCQQKQIDIENNCVFDNLDNTNMSIAKKKKHLILRFTQELIMTLDAF